MCTTPENRITNHNWAKLEREILKGYTSEEAGNAVTSEKPWEIPSIFVYFLIHVSSSSRQRRPQHRSRQEFGGN